MKTTILTVFLLVTACLTIYGQDNFLKKGNEYLNAKQFDQAEQIFRDGIKADSTNLVYQCQLGLTLIEQKKYIDAENILNLVLKVDSNNDGAIWYSGICNYQGGNYGKAITKFEKALTLLDKNSGQYYSANWFIGKSYSKLLKTEGLTFQETDRMFECLEEYVRLQPNAEDAAKIKEYVERKKQRRPPSNVKKWVDL
jgi:tetratricopeptide (TPR) repeat protein